MVKLRTWPEAKTLIDELQAVIDAISVTLDNVNPRATRVNVTIP